MDPLSCSSINTFSEVDNQAAEIFITGLHNHIAWKEPVMFIWTNPPQTRSSLSPLLRDLNSEVLTASRHGGLLTCLGPCFTSWPTFCEKSPYFITTEFPMFQIKLIASCPDTVHFSLTPGQQHPGPGASRGWRLLLHYVACHGASAVLCGTSPGVCCTTWYFTTSAV